MATAATHTAADENTSAGLKAEAESKWPEPIKFVQEIAESGIKLLPPEYIKFEQGQALHGQTAAPPQQLPPVIDMSIIGGATGTAEKKAMLQLLDSACREWGMFQVINHGISPALLDAVKRVSRAFFNLPMEEKLKYANDPVTYEGYGNRTGMQKGSTHLDWNDYFYHFIRPVSASNGQMKWPHQPDDYRTVIGEYGEKVVGLCEALLSIFSEDLGLEKKETLLESLGGDEELEAGYRMNFYPKCPQPELALGLSPHTDPGAMTVLLQDQVSGLQINKDGVWVPVPPLQDALTVFVADQLEILSNGIYKSVNHRTTVNSTKERTSIAIFVYPEGSRMIGPLEEVVKKRECSPLYSEMTFNEYRQFIRTLGLKGKAILASRFINP